MTIIASDVSGTAIVSNIGTGAPAYVAGSVLSNKTETGAFLIQVHQTSNDAVVTGGNIFSGTEFNFTSGAAVTYATISGGLPYPSWTPSGYAGVEVYAKVTVSGANITEANDFEYFLVTGDPAISNQTLDNFAINTTELTIASCDVTNMGANDEVYCEINGNVFKMDTSDNANYTKTINGRDIGTVTAGTVKFIASNGSGSDEQNAGNTITVSALSINAATIVHDATLNLRAILSSTVTDPISGTRIGNERFVMTSWPERNVRYPVLSIENENNSDQSLGVGVDSAEKKLIFKLVIHAKNTKQRDQIYDDVYDSLRTKQYTDTISGGLLGFKEESAFSLNEPGKEGLHRKVVMIGYKHYV